MLIPSYLAEGDCAGFVAVWTPGGDGIAGCIAIALETVFHIRPESVEYSRCVRRACFVYIGLFPPERFAVPGAVFPPVLLGVVFELRGVTGPLERRFTCFVRAMVCGQAWEEREVGRALVSAKWL